MTIFVCQLLGQIYAAVNMSWYFAEYFLISVIILPHQMSNVTLTSFSLIYLAIQLSISVLLSEKSEYQ